MLLIGLELSVLMENYCFDMDDVWLNLDLLLFFMASGLWRIGILLPLAWLIFSGAWERHLDPPCVPLRGICVLEASKE